MSSQFAGRRRILGLGGVERQGSRVVVSDHPVREKGHRRAIGMLHADHHISMAGEFLRLVGVL
jgi:hypothetical protein